MSSEDLVKRFRSRQQLDRSGISELAAHVESISKMEEFQTFYGECVRAEDPLDVPFINRNLLSTRTIWQSNYQRILDVSEASQS